MRSSRSMAKCGMRQRYLVVPWQALVAVGHGLEHIELLVAVFLLDDELALVVRPAPLAQLVRLQTALAGVIRFAPARLHRWRCPQQATDLLLLCS